MVHLTGGGGETVAVFMSLARYRRFADGCQPARKEKFGFEEIVAGFREAIEVDDYNMDDAFNGTLANHAGEASLTLLLPFRRFPNSIGSVYHCNRGLFNSAWEQ